MNSIRLSLFFALLLWPQLPAQSTWTVPGQFPDIQSAIDAAMSGDTIQIAAGHYLENLQIWKSLTIEGVGPSTIVDGNLQNRCIQVSVNDGANVTIRDLELTQGRKVSTPLSSLDRGAGLHFHVAGQGSMASLTLEQVTISHCEAPFGGAIYSTLGTHIDLSHCNFSDNGFQPTTSAGFNIHGGALLVDGGLTATNCSFTNNNVQGATTIGVGGAIAAQGDAQVHLEACSFQGNVATQGAALGTAMNTNAQIQILGCEFVANTSTFGSSAIFIAPATTGASFEMQNCLLRDNVSSSLNFGPIYVATGTAEITGSTFVRNSNGLGPQTAQMIFGPCMGVAIRNSILGLNDGAPPFQQSLPAGQFNVSHCLFEGPSTSTYPALPSNIHGIEAGFVDPMAANFHLRPASAAVNAGLHQANDASVDLGGLPRNQLGAPDMGCYELQPGEEDPGAAWAGTVPDLMGGLADVLFVNGAAGGVGRRVNTSLGSLTMIGVDAAPGTTNGLFIIWGRIGTPGTVEAFPIPFAQGSMAFLPHLLALGNPALFTFASSSLPGGLFAATPAPWTIAGSSLPFPLTITLQGLIETSGGNVRLTNAIAIHNF